MDRRLTVVWAIFFGVLAGCNCSKTRLTRSDQSSVVVQTDAGQPNAVEAKPALLCAGVKDGVEFALGTENGNAEDDDSGLDMPFGINVGQAIGYDGGFAVTAIDGRAGKSHAVLAVMGQSAQNAKRLDLGRVYGDADPPHVAGDSRNLVLALADMDAAGRTMRLLRVEDPSGASRLVRGAEVSVAENSSTTFVIAANAEHGIVAWEQTDRKTDLTQIALSHFLVQSLTLVKKLPIASSGKSDAEAPQIVSRDGGFWLGWAQSPAPKARDSASKGSTTIRAQRKQTSADEPGMPVVDLGARDLYVVALDLEGRAISKPLRVTEGPARAVTYEMATLGDSSALFAWRDDDTSPGVESQVVHVARVGLDGHVEHFRLEDDSIGVGEPQLLLDSSADSEDRAWLAIGNTGEKVSLVKLQPNGDPVLPIIEDVDWGVANPLVRFAGVVLVARQRGGSVDLEPLRCKFGRR